MILCMLKVTKLFNDKQVWWLPIKYKVWKNSLGKFVELRENLERFIEVGAADGAEFGVGPSRGWGHAGVAGVPVPGVWPFHGCGGACGLCPEPGARRLCAPHLSRFILLVSFSDTLLVVSILGIVYDCYLRPLLQS